MAGREDSAQSGERAADGARERGGFGVVELIEGGDMAASTNDGPSGEVGTTATGSGTAAPWWLPPSPGSVGSGPQCCSHHTGQVKITVANISPSPRSGPAKARAAHRFTVTRPHRISTPPRPGDAATTYRNRSALQAVSDGLTPGSAANP